MSTTRGEPQADKVFNRLNGAAATRSVLLRSVLLTNRVLGPGLTQRCSQSGDTDIHEEWTHYEVASGSGDAVVDRDATIMVDKRSVAELTTAIEDLVRQFRSDQHLGMSSVSCRIVAKLLWLYATKLGRRVRIRDV